MLNLTDTLTPSNAEINNRYQVDLPQFFGPMDLLLSLIEQEELEITKIALAQVTDQYLGYIEALQQVTPDALTEFLVVATRLILLKSQTLLPKPPPSIIAEEEDATDDLIQQLKDYKRFKQLAVQLGKIQAAGLHSFIRIASPPGVKPKLTIGDLHIDDLLKAVRAALAVKPDPPGVNSVVSPETITIGNRINLIKHKLTSHNRVEFNDLLTQTNSRIEVIVTLLAVLELVKRRMVTVEQMEDFGEITITKLKDIALSENDWTALSQMREIS